MFRNYLVTALRNIARHKLHSFINIGGLAVGLASVILVMLFARDELSYDRWVPGTGNLYRVEMAIVIPDRPILNLSVIPFPMAPAMRAQSPSVTGFAQFYNAAMTLTTRDRQFLQKVEQVNPEFFTVIRYPLIVGDPATVFRQPDSLVLSQAAARKYFGDANPIGRTLTTGRGDCAREDAECLRQVISLKVTGVMKDLPHNTQLEGDVFLPVTSRASRISQDQKTDWFSQNGWGYVRLAPGTNTAALVAGMAGMLDRNVTPALRRFGVTGTGSKSYLIHLTPFAGVHLHSAQWLFNTTAPGSLVTVYGVVAIGVLILLVACFNFMNLSTARAMMRAREIALRKTVGASQRQLMLQFLGEAVLMALLALVLGLAAAEVALGPFGAFLQRPIAFEYIADWPLLLLMLAVAVAAGLLSGLYPALVLSRFRPAGTLRANSAGQNGSGLFRNLLVVLQFAVSIGLGIAAAVVFSQITYARNIDLGFRHENVLIIGSGRMNQTQREAFAQTLRSNPGVIEVGQSNMAPFDAGQSLALIQVPGHSEIITLNGIAIDPGYPKVYGIRLLAGRLLSEDRSDDAFHSMMPDPDPLNEGKNLLVNESGAHRLGFSPQQAVGQSIVFNHSHVRIVGVIADTKIHGALEPVHPTAYAYIPSYPLEFSVRLRPDLTPQTLAFIDRAWHAFSPDAAIQRYFLTGNFDKLYSDNERQGAMFGVFVAIAIVIACLGLFGLAAFTAGRRTREIGIRKVFGARVFQIVWLLLTQFSTPVLIANLIAWPLAWYYLHGWLQGFAYRITLSPLYFVSAGLLALVIAWATVLSHALRVASASPIHALHTE